LIPAADFSLTPRRGSIFPSLPLAAGTLATRAGYPAASDKTTRGPWMLPVSPSLSPSPMPSPSPSRPHPLSTASISFAQSLPHSFAHSLPESITHSLTHSPSPSLRHSIIPSRSDSLIPIPPNHLLILHSRTDPGSRRRHERGSPNQVAMPPSPSAAGSLCQGSPTGRAPF
jgi:hypothetical protein